MLDTTNITNVKFDDVFHWDYPEYCDAFIASAEINGVPLTESELDELNENDDFKHTELINQIF